VTQSAIKIAYVVEGEKHLQKLNTIISIETFNTYKTLLLTLGLKQHCYSGLQTYIIEKIQIEY